MCTNEATESQRQNEGLFDLLFERKMANDIGCNPCASAVRRTLIILSVDNAFRCGAFPVLRLQPLVREPVGKKRPVQALFPCLVLPFTF